MAGDEGGSMRATEIPRDHRDLLLDAATRFAGSLDTAAILEGMAGLGVPGYARWSGVWLLEARGRLRRAEAGDARALADTTRGELEALVQRLLEDPAPATGCRGSDAFLVVPVRAEGAVIGALAWLAPPASTSYSAEAIAVAERLARLGGAALAAARRYEESESNNRMKDEFLATLSHELRTPLAAVLGWASLVRSDGLEPAEVAVALEAIERNARAQCRLVDDVLEVSRIATGNIRLVRRPLDLGASIRGVVDACRPLAQAKTLTLSFDLPLAPAMVLGDADRLRQVWSNLLSNAIKFTPPSGTVWVTLQRIGAWYEVAVRDTGEGIAADILPYIFERFRQGENASSRGHGGLGLGLALVRHFVDLLGGTVEARSDGPGQGAELLVRLPALASESMLPLVPPADAPERAEAHRLLAGIAVLLVDDDRDTRAMMRAVLNRRGATVIEAESVAQALAAVERQPPDVILSDLQMPGEDGYVLLERLRERARRGARAIPTAAVTAHAGDEHRVRALAAGFQAQVAKPIDAETLARLVARLALDQPRTAPG